jgi:hypothetical protein
MEKLTNLKNEIDKPINIGDSLPKEDYPVQLIELSVGLTRLGSKFEKLNKTVIDVMVNQLLKIARRNLDKNKIHFGVVNFECSVGYLPPFNELSIRLIVIGNELLDNYIDYQISIEIKTEVVSDTGGTANFKSYELDQTGLQVQIIPIHTPSLGEFLSSIKSNLLDKRFFTDDVLKAVLTENIFMDKEQLMSPKFKFEL